MPRIARKWQELPKIALNKEIYPEFSESIKRELFDIKKGGNARSKAAIATKKPSGKRLFPVFFYGVGEVPAVCQQKGCYGENHKGGFSLQPVKENYN